MDLIKELFYGNTKYRYMENGFSEGEAEAMSWIAKQKAKGKLYGATTGLFLAVSWGHWHQRLLKPFPFYWNKRLTQLGIIMGSILLMDYYLTSRRKGANELIANNFLLNTNLLHANIDSLIENFQVFDQKFTEQQIEAFNYRRKLLQTNHHDIQNKKWVHNPMIHTPQQFFKRYADATISPWVQDAKPANFSKILDVKGDTFGIPTSWHFNWAQIH